MLTVSTAAVAVYDARAPPLAKPQLLSSAE
jgi:hypothetical protein